MTGIVEKVLVVGGGFSGMSAAIELRKQGIETHLVEIDSEWQADGAGITVGGATLRAFRELGILDDFLEFGSGNDGLEVRAPTGQLITTIPMPRFVDPDIPGAGAIMRPVLARIMAKVVKSSGTHVKLGQSYESIEQDERGATVTFTDGSVDHFDLVVAADGLRSKTREWLFPDAPEPRYTGQGVWRAVLPRPADINCTRMWVGEHLKAGINPMSKEQVYLFLTEDRETRERIAEEEQPEMLKKLLVENFPAPEVHQLAAHIGDDSRVMYRPLDGLLIPGPWHKGRVVLIGDTVHATTPHLASGACIGIEDGIILVEEIARGESLEQSLTAFHDRRWERCRMVVENSGRLGDIEINRGDKAEHAEIMRVSMETLRDPI